MINKNKCWLTTPFENIEIGEEFEFFTRKWKKNSFTSAERQDNKCICDFSDFDLVIVPHVQGMQHDQENTTVS
jgi:hypothetical protein